MGKRAAATASACAPAAPHEEALEPAPKPKALASKAKQAAEPQEQPPKPTLATQAAAPKPKGRRRKFPHPELGSALVGAVGPEEQPAALVPVDAPDVQDAFKVPRLSVVPDMFKNSYDMAVAALAAAAVPPGAGLREGALALALAPIECEAAGEPSRPSDVLADSQIQVQDVVGDSIRIESKDDDRQEMMGHDSDVEEDPVPTLTSDATMTTSHDKPDEEKSSVMAEQVPSTDDVHQQADPPLKDPMEKPDGHAREEAGF